MDEIAQNRLAICDFLNAKKPENTAKPASAAINSVANRDDLKVLAAIGSAGLEQVWQQHPAKQSYEQIAPIAKSLVRQHPMLTLGAASALGALVVLSPGLRRKAWQGLQGQLPAELQSLF
jgi:hypothetical protein